MASAALTLLALLALAALAAALPLQPFEATQGGDDDSGGDPSFDHQKVTYTAKFAPISPSAAGMSRCCCGALLTDTHTGVSAMPYFSPDHAIQTQTELLLNATVSIDISIPGYDMWSECANYV